MTLPWYFWLDMAALFSLIIYGVIRGMWWGGGGDGDGGG